MFATFVEQTGYETDAEQRGNSYVYVGGEGWESVEGADWQHPQGPSSDIDGLGNHLVVHVSWNDAQAYCEWTERRLPTEAEWEKAARGTEGYRYPWGKGDVTGNLLNFADRNLDASWADDGVNDVYEFTAPVGSYPNGDSPYGALDMAGNVWEWVSDWFGENYYGESPSSNPVGPDSGGYRVLRGGSWGDVGDSVRAASRSRYNPQDTLSNIGFRCVRSAASP